MAFKSKYCSKSYSTLEDSKDRYLLSRYKNWVDRELEEIEWNRVRNINQKNEYIKFLKLYPGNINYSEARLRASIQSIQIKKTNEEQVMRCFPPTLRNILPDTRISTTKNHIFIIAKLTFLPIENFDMNVGTIMFINKRHQKFNAINEISDGIWEMTESIREEILKSKNIIMNKYYIQSTPYHFYATEKRTLSFLFIVPKDSVKGSKVSIDYVNFYIKNYM